MKKFSYLFVVLAVALSVFSTSCQKEDDSHVLSVFTEQCGAHKLYIDSIDHAPIPFFFTGDEVLLNGRHAAFVYDQTRDGYVITDYVESFSGYLAFFPYYLFQPAIAEQMEAFDIDPTDPDEMSDYIEYFIKPNKQMDVEIPREQQYHEYPAAAGSLAGTQYVPMPMVAWTLDDEYEPVGTGNQLYFYNFGSIIEVTFQNLTQSSLRLDSINVLCDASITGSFSVDWIDRTNPQMEGPGGSYKTKSVSLRFENIPQNVAGGASSKRFCIPMGCRPDIDQSNHEFNIYVYATDNQGEQHMYKRTYNKRWNRNTYAATTLSTSNLYVPGADPDPDPQSVYYFKSSENTFMQISSGNLQFQASTGSWQFASNQYDVIGSANEYIAANYAGWIDLFGWGAGNVPTATTANQVDATFDEFGGNLTAASWRSPSSAEMEYLFGHYNLQDHELQNNEHYYVTVHNVGGFLFVPYNVSNWERQNVYNNLSNNQTISDDDWGRLNSYGAIFFPSTGYRDVTTYYSTWQYNQDKNYSGAYWTSSAGTSNFGNHFHVFAFNGNHQSGKIGQYRQRGHAVRMVRNYTPTAKTGRR